LHPLSELIPAPVSTTTVFILFCLKPFTHYRFKSPVRLFRINNNKIDYEITIQNKGTYFIKRRIPDSGMKRGLWQGGYMARTP
jgi:hypothetical protein